MNARTNAAGAVLGPCDARVMLSTGYTPEHISGMCLFATRIAHVCTSNMFDI
jgi:hypothetical protein